VFSTPGTVILHADVDAFFASVAQRDDPALRGRPVIVGGGVVMAASYEARRFGVRSGMGGAQARRLCPQAIIATPSWSDYVAASTAVFAVFDRTAAVVEPMGIEEAYRTPVQPGRPPRSFGTQRSLAGARGRRLTAQERDETLAGLAERVTARMAKAGYTGRTVILRLRFADFSRATRSHTLPDATAAAEPVLAAARVLLAAATPAIERQGLTLLGLSVTNLVDSGVGPRLVPEPEAGEPDVSG